jgi:hypothetical protein
VPFVDEGRTNAGFVHPQYTSNSNHSLSQNSWIYTVYLGKEGSIPEAQMTANMKILKGDIRIDSPE